MDVILRNPLTFDHLMPKNDRHEPQEKETPYRNTLIKKKGLTTWAAP